MLLENVSFKGKTGIITGGAQGIGKAIASQLVAMGGRAVIVDINPVTGEETCRELGNAAFYAVDLADAGQVVRVFEQIIADEKHVDVLINNAGIVNTDDFQDLSLEQWNKILAVDLTAVFLACQVCFRHMAEIGGGRIVFDFVSPFGNIKDVELGVPVSINIENGIAAMALAQIAGATEEEIRRGMLSFEGVVRRFDFKLKTDRIVFLSDYAHHPAEIRQSVLSLFDGRKLTAIFQPHLYTRTRDFYKDFANSLSLLDEVILTEIYPAREQPIPGVTSQIIFDELRPDMQRRICQKTDVPQIVENEDFDVLIVLGAGDLDNYCDEITEILKRKYC